jgi:hypothetical protein
MQAPYNRCSEYNIANGRKANDEKLSQQLCRLLYEEEVINYVYKVRIKAIKNT